MVRLETLFRALLDDPDRGISHQETYFMVLPQFLMTPDVNILQRVIQEALGRLNYEE